MEHSVQFEALKIKAAAYALRSEGLIDVPVIYGSQAALTVALAALCESQRMLLGDILGLIEDMKGELKW